MKTRSLNRRQFLRAATFTTAAARVFPAVRAAKKPEGAFWLIGCFNRPWKRWGGFLV